MLYDLLQKLIGENVAFTLRTPDGSHVTTSLLVKNIPTRKENHVHIVTDNELEQVWISATGISKIQEFEIEDGEEDLNKIHYLIDYDNGNVFEITVLV